MAKGLVLQVLQRLREQKLSRDIAYSLGSFAVLAASGIVINIAIAALRDAAALGVFNLAYAVYIVASQVATWGLHYSVLRHTAYHANDPQELTALLGTAGACALALGSTAALALWLAEPLLKQVFNSTAASAAMACSAIGLVVFPLNKVLLAYLNGLRCMRAHALLQAERYLLVTAGVCAVVASDLPMEHAAFAFGIAEGVTCASALLFIAHARLNQRPRWSARWARQHFAFGTRGLPAGMFTEINARIDVLLLGMFVSESSVGIYSFAAMLVDGAYQVLAVVRLNFNPLLVAALKIGDFAHLHRLRTMSLRYAMPLMLMLSAALVGAYLIASHWILPEKGLQDGLVALLILLAGLNLVSTWIPFDNLMLVAGHPGHQAFQQMASVCSNIVVSLLLIPSMGLAGAATGTAVSYVVGILVLFVFARRMLGWRLIYKS